MISYSSSVVTETINNWSMADEMEFHLEKERDLLSNRSYYSFAQKEDEQSSVEVINITTISVQAASENDKSDLAGDLGSGNDELLPSLDLKGLFAEDEISDLPNSDHGIDDFDPDDPLPDLDLSGLFEVPTSVENVIEERRAAIEDDEWADFFPETEEGQEDLILVGSLIDDEGICSAESLKEEDSDQEKIETRATEDKAWFDYYPDDDEDLDDSSWADGLGIDTEGAVSREERAWQVASAVGEEHALDKNEVEALAEIFVENGWSACRVAIARELTAGTTVEELIIAASVKEVWEEYSEFYDDFSTSYRTMSWPLAPKIIRSFEGYPDIEEIEQLLVRLFDHWTSDKIARRLTPTFGEYLFAKFFNLEGSCDVSCEWEIHGARYIEPDFFLPPCSHDIPPITNDPHSGLWLANTRKYNIY